MDPFTLGLVSLGAAGGSLAIVGAFQRSGVQINESALLIVLEIAKYGGILWLMKEMARVFV